MTTVKSRRELRKQTDPFVMVEREDQIFIRVGDEYVAKRYFSPAEAQKIMAAKRYEVYQLITKLGIHPSAKKRETIRITLPQLRMMIDLQSKTDNV